MHIPDGYLNLPTCVATYGVMTPVWVIAAQKLKQSLHAKQVPLLALGAAFSFVLMMLNFPLPGGSSGHAVGGALLAIVLGPWAAIVILSVVVAIQALLFHDGGLTTFGANAFTMAFILPAVSYGLYHLFSRKKSSLYAKGLAGAFAGYIGLTAAALVVGILLGIQPHGASGYFPYPITVTVPVMVGSHLLVFSWVEGLVTGAALIWIYKNSPLTNEEDTRPAARFGWIAVMALILLSPLGLLAKGTAFGEWSADQLKTALGYVPAGFTRFMTHAYGPLAGYHIQGHSLIYGYLLSAVIGAAAAGMFALFLGKFFADEKIALTSDSLEETPPYGELPLWLSQAERAPVKQAKETPSFTQKTLDKIANFFVQLSVLEKYQKADGFLQKQNARRKLLIFSMAIILSAWLRVPEILLGLLALAIFLSYQSKIPSGWFIRAILLPMAVFSAIIIAPAALLAKSGISLSFLLILRATTAFAYSALLSLTTPWAQLLSALTVFRIPQIFVFVLEMTVRYIFLFVRLLEQISFAKRARTIVPHSLGDEQRWSAGRAFFLLQRSLELSENVYKAMIARGYRGKMKEPIPADF